MARVDPAGSEPASSGGTGPSGTSPHDAEARPLIDLTSRPSTVTYLREAWRRREFGRGVVRLALSGGYGTEPRLEVSIAVRESL